MTKGRRVVVSDLRPFEADTPTSVNESNQDSTTDVKYVSIKNGVTKTRDSNGYLHSFNDEPSYSSDDGTVREWHRHGVLHRENDLPAVENQRQQEWWCHGRRVRKVRHTDNIECELSRWRDEERSGLAFVALTIMVLFAFYFMCHITW